jgi:succinate dehydrogenase / fumarate reductase, iron-sulfur subunit
MNYSFKIYRYDPGKDKEPYYRVYKLNVEPTERILDCLNRIRWEQDPTISFRMSCAHGVCGSDGMKINGICGLACQKLVRDYEEGTIIIEPLPNFPVIKDLIVHLESFFEKYRHMKPYLLTESNEPEGERLQTIAERKIFDEAIRCILCACCTAACPVMDDRKDFVGPAALLRSFRYFFDSRDEGLKERIAIVDKKNGVWGCKAHGKCTEVCPKEIQVAKSIGKTKKKIYDIKKG